MITTASRVPGNPPAAACFLRGFGLDVDAWQTEVLDSRQQRLLVNACRKAGKSTVAALLALREALSTPQTHVMLLGRSHRRADHLFKRFRTFHDRLGAPLLAKRIRSELRLANGSLVASQPAIERSLRDYPKIDLLIVDDAARVADDLYRTAQVRVGLARGRAVCLTTPLGRRGFFYEAWRSGCDGWARLEVPAERIDRLPRPLCPNRRRVLGEAWYRQEFACAFEEVVGLIYPELSRSVVAALVPLGRSVGGIDFGLRNPFAAVWGVVDAAGVLWLSGEHYEREKPLAYHLERLPRDVHWYADPSGAREIHELRYAGLKIERAARKRATIAAVRRRLEQGRLRLLEACCPTLLAETAQYRLDPAADYRRPLKEHDHMLDALRYLVSGIEE